jgi:acyl carrier protein
VLGGIAEADWNRILQIAMEIHNVDGELEIIRRLLEEKGFAVTVEQEAWFRGASNFNLYARRPGIQMAPGRPVEEGAKNAWRSCRQLTAELREHLRARLPDYMVPSQIALLENLPLTANGKVDRARLPRAAESDRASVFDPPRTREEIEIAAIWTRVLGVAKVGRTGNFFELGGHSLLATQVISRLRDAFSVEIPIRRLFESPTVAELAEAVVQAQVAAPVVTPVLEPLARERFRLKHAVSSP